MIDLNIRRAESGDVDRLALIGGATFLDTFAGVLGGSSIVQHCRVNHSSEYYAKSLFSGCRAFLAEVEPDGAPVGFALLGPSELPETSEQDLELKRIYLLSRFQGRGCGSALLDQALEVASGYRRLVLGVFSGNAKAQRFYVRHGFRQIAKRKFNVGGVSYDDDVFAREMTE